jgi:hypothetical protein
MPSPDARRAKSEQAFGVASFEATSLIAAIPAEDCGRSAHRRAPLKPPTVRGNTVVGATAALGAVVTGGFMAGSPSVPGATADAAEAALPATSLAASTQPLHIATVASGSTFHDISATTAMLPVVVPGDRVAANDNRDVEALHKGEALAAEAVAQHALAVKEASILAGGGGLDDWIAVALGKLNLPQALSGGVKRVIMAESRGNPHAINRTDSNAMAGRPSQGLMQVIPSTFRAYVLPELAGRPITDPVANITAGVRYMIANYGIGTLKAGGRRFNGQYVGY